MLICRNILTILIPLKIRHVKHQVFVNILNIFVFSDLLNIAFMNVYFLVKIENQDILEI